MKSSFGIQRSGCPRVWQMERLEGRDLMAGDVTATLVDGSLVIRGDAAANEIEISQLSNGRYLIAGDSSTRVNGRSGAQSFQVTRDLDINLGGGDDELRIRANPVAPLPGDLIITTEAGNDRVEIESFRVRDDALIDLGDGSDRLDIDRMRVGGLGTDSNQNDLTVLAGSGSDEIKIDRTQVARDLLVDGGLGFAPNKIELSSLRVGGNLTVQTYDGVDEIKISGDSSNRTVVTGDVRIDSGKGNDVATVEFVTADEIFASMGDGNDVLRIGNSRFRTGTLDGGLGSDDRFNTIAPNSFTVAPTITRFERFGS